MPAATLQSSFLHEGAREDLAYRRPADVQGMQQEAAGGPAGVVEVFQGRNTAALPGCQ